MMSAITVVCACMSQHPDERVAHRFLGIACKGTGRILDRNLLIHGDGGECPDPERCDDPNREWLR